MVYFFKKSTSKVFLMILTATYALFYAWIRYSFVGIFILHKVLDAFCAQNDRNRKVFQNCSRLNEQYFDLGSRHYCFRFRGVSTFFMYLGDQHFLSFYGGVIFWSMRVIFWKCRPQPEKCGPLRVVFWWI